MTPLETTIAPLKVVGTRAVRIDAVDKATGHARFAPDLNLEGMLHARILRSPHPHARVISIDASRAWKVPGVRVILPAGEVPRVVGTWFNLRSEKEIKKLFMQDDKVRFVGDPVLAVAAENEEAAAEALDVINVEYEVLPHVFDPFEALARDDIKIHARGNVGFHVLKEYGDLEQGFAQADVVVEHRYVTSKQKHASLEPCATCIADYSSGRLTLWSASQVPHWVLMYLGLTHNLPVSRIRVIRPYVGGAFGSRAGVVPGSELMCTFLARKAGRPVRLAFSREEDFSTTESRHPFTIDMRSGVTRDGLLVAADAHIVMDVGGYGTHFVSVLADALGTGVGFYRVPNYRFEGTCVFTNKVLGGAFRGYGNPQFNFAQEQQIDALAEAIGMDPIELRIKNYRGAGEVDPVFGVQVGSDGFKECLWRGAEAIGWKGWRERKPAPAALETAGNATPSGVSGIKRGIGLAAHQHGTGARFGLPDPSSAIVMVNVDGSIDLLTACADDGQGNRTVLAQIAAEVLGVRLEDVTVSDTDTAVAPLDAGTHGSRQTYCGGVAVMRAAADARAKVLDLAAEYLGTSASRLTITDGAVRDAEAPDTSVDLPTLMRHFQVGDFSRCHQVIGSESGVTEAQPPVFGATFAEVEVDTETGQVKVVKMVGAFDIGAAINPAHCEGQITGGLTMGVGYALTEGLIIEEGRVVNPGFRDYKVLRADDVPELIPVLVESHEPTGPFGAKGLGEATMISSAAAIANAVHDAIGVRMCELCITPERILTALQESQQR
ncbi:MAG: molybdopterin-dependent oxidoreductase [Gaiellales bacterium]|nr:molybdopterin-dependent oxidoreductase [Gaiellales bacterium]